jgi:hypothetical protein
VLPSRFAALAIEPIGQAIARIAATGSQLSSVRLPGDAAP